MDKVIIFDTTLRDGEQAAGATLNNQEKVEIARQLEKLGVDIIEAGMPVNSQTELEAVALISKAVRNATICGLARALPTDIDKAWGSSQDSRGSTHTCISFCVRYPHNAPVEEKPR